MLCDIFSKVSGIIKFDMPDLPNRTIFNLNVWYFCGKKCECITEGEGFSILDGYQS